jgi:hypothetical protein
MKNVKIKTNTTTPATTATTADTTATSVIGTGAIFIAKSLVGVIAASAVSVLTSKVLKTGASQKAYEEAIKEFSAK